MMELSLNKYLLHGLVERLIGRIAHRNQRLELRED